MSEYRFGRLCEAYEKAHEEMEEYLGEYGQLLGNLLTEFEVYLNCPSGRITYHSKKGEKTSLREAMYLEQGAWRLDLGLCMWRENGTRTIPVSESGLYYPLQTVLFSILVRGTADAFVAKLVPFDQEFPITKIGRDISKTIFYDFIIEQIESHYKNMLHSILEHDKVPKKLGNISIG